MLRRNLERLSSSVDWLLARTEWSDRLPIIYVLEYPRSGGTWVADMLADYFQLPFPNHNVFPLGAPGVIHGHWRYSPRFTNVVYVCRDGRDVLVSRYWNLFGAGLSRRVLWKNRLLYGRYWWVDDRAALKAIDENLAEFVDDWHERPRGVRGSWDQHVDEWTEADENVVCVAYEQFQKDAVEALTKLVSRLSGESPDVWRVKTTVEKFSFERQTGRARGVADPSSAKRKGVVGDWKNSFTLETARKFEGYCGETLRRLGYEEDPDWWRRG